MKTIAQVKQGVHTMKVKEREVPQLRAEEGSWMIVRVSNGEPVIEVFKNSKAAGHLKYLSPQFVAVPIQKYLSDKCVDTQ